MQALNAGLAELSANVQRIEVELQAAEAEEEAALKAEAETRAAAAAAKLAEKAGLGRTAAGKEIVDRARLLVQQKTGGKPTAAVSKPFAEADHLLLTGDLTGAVAKLRTAYRAV